MTQPASQSAHLSIDDYAKIADVFNEQIRPLLPPNTAITAEYTERGTCGYYYLPPTQVSHHLLLRVTYDFGGTHINLIAGSDGNFRDDGVLSTWDISYIDGHCSNPLRVLGTRHLRSDDVEAGQQFRLRLDLPGLVSDVTTGPGLIVDIIRQAKWWSSHPLPATK